MESSPAEEESSVRVSSSEGLELESPLEKNWVVSSSSVATQTQESDGVRSDSLSSQQRRPPISKFSGSDSFSRSRLGSGTAGSGHTGERPARPSSFFSGREKKPSLFSRGRLKQQETLPEQSTKLPPGFEKESGSHSGVPDWVNSLDHSRAQLGPTGKHVKDMVAPVTPAPDLSESPSVRTTPLTKGRFTGGFPSRMEKTSSSGGALQRDKSLFSKCTPSEVVHFSDPPLVGKGKVAGFPGNKEGSYRERGSGFKGDAPHSRSSGKHGENRKGGAFRSGSEQSHSRKTFTPKTADVDIPPVVPEQLKVALPISVASLAAAMKMRTAQLVSRMFMQGVVLRSNDVLEQETLVQLIGNEFGCSIEVNAQALERGQVFRKTILEELGQADPKDLVSRAPVIAVVGHVDHGKTSLIDAIRQSDLTKHEPGEITQHIGAFSISIPDGSFLTVLDTPGHEAFSAMRDRGVRVADVVVLVIAGDEGIKAQTEEAIRIIKEAENSVVIVLTKSDKANFDQDRVFRQLAERDLLPESWGGSVVTAVCSAHQGVGVSDLLELLQLQASLLQLKANPKDRARGVIVESRVDLGLGPSATVLIQNGTLFQGDLVVAGSSWGKVRTIKNDRNKSLKQVTAGFAASISGLSSPPSVGEPFVVVPNEQEARWATEVHAKTQVSMRPLMISPEAFMERGLGIRKRTLYVVLCGDVHGSVEALAQALRQIPSERVDIEVVYQTVGVIGESLVSLASAAKAVIVGFQTSIDVRAQVLSKSLGVSIHVFQIIYRAVEAVTELMQKLLDKTCQEKFSGIAEIRAIFKSSKFGVIAGCGITNGVVKRNQVVRVMRGGKALHSGRILSMRTGRDDLKESSKGFECGIIVENFSDFQIGDELHAFDLIYLSQGLLECDDEKQD
ncbi:Translation initiation factor 2 [Candidatus Similichlamydia laticola]|uniref:Translation initiation factor IF-2 n=1 Tax=Candidatus Similichlamydia laticola TaxID=2170265 RepID=A0A369KCX3_9BACT|nr:Translation initiation factor 2 [Candidatus Similichlamydia laticola]